MSAVVVQVLFGLSRRRPGPDDARPAIRAGRGVVAPSGGPGPLASGSLGAAPAGAAASPGSAAALATTTSSLIAKPELIKQQERDLLDTRS
jgi:hypothetical protein